MMMLLSVFAAAVLFGYLFVMARRKGIPDMVSDTYYQLGRHGWVFSVVLAVSAVAMMIVLLDSGKGLQWAAFIGTAGTAFVGFAPNYLDREDYAVHKTAAIVAAVGCTAWCMSVNVCPTMVIGGMYVLYAIGADIARRTGRSIKSHLWYWGEVACFADVWGTWWCV